MNFSSFKIHYKYKYVYENIVWTTYIYIVHKASSFFSCTGPVHADTRRSSRVPPVSSDRNQTAGRQELRRPAVRDPTRYHAFSSTKSLSCKCRCSLKEHVYKVFTLRVGT